MVKSTADYENDIIPLHNGLKEYPDSTTLQEKLSRRLSAWVGKLNITIHVASNEQLPYTIKELGYPITPMSTIKAGGERQVGDYIFYLDDYDMFGGLVVERKGVTRTNGRMVGCDLYSTFSTKDNRDRFYREIQRYKDDPRFNLFVLIAECSHGEYLSFKPAFNGKNYNKTNYGMNVAARRATIAKLISMGCVVHFAGTRHHAVELYHDLVVQWCRTYYATILKGENI